MCDYGGGDAEAGCDGGIAMISQFRRYGGWIFLGAVLIIIHKMVENYEYFFGGFHKFTTIMTPFVWGFIITYFLMGLMRWLERQFKMKRVFSFILTYLLFFGTLGLFVSIVAPVIAENVMDIAKLSPKYAYETREFVNNVSRELRVIDTLGLENVFAENIESLSKTALNFLNTMLNSVITGVIGFTSWVFKFLFGIIISMYIMINVENFERVSKKFFLAMYGQEKADKILEFLTMSDRIFKDFFFGKLIDSTIIGVLCYIGLAILKAPYVMLLSLIVGIFNMIPYVGPIIGAIPAVVITLFVSPVKALWVALFIFLLQQLDGNVIGPWVLGGKVGVSPYGIVLAIAIGGGYFGIPGMLVSVPIYKILTIVLGKAMDKKIESSDSFLG